MNKQAPRLLHWLRWILGAVVIILVITLVGISVAVHLMSAPAMLALPKGASSATSSGSPAVDGTWSAGPGSIVGWRVQQIILGQQLPLVGRTNKVMGSITVVDGLVTQGSFTVDMSALISSLSKTTQRTVFDVSDYPTATLILTRPIKIGAIPADSTVERFPATADVTLHGVRREVNLSVAAKRSGGSVYLLADIAFPYGDWDIVAQGVPFLADLQSPATIEVLLHLHPSSAMS